MSPGIFTAPQKRLNLPFLPVPECKEFRVRDRFPQSISTITVSASPIARQCPNPVTSNSRKYICLMVRATKRVRALRRAPDGSAFIKCDDCGVSVAVALADLHECAIKKDVKRFKGKSQPPQIITGANFQDQPRSAFCFFMERYSSISQGENLIDVNRKGFEKWRNMSTEERKPFTDQATKVDVAYLKTLLQEVNHKPRADDGANSAWVGKYDQCYYQVFDSSGTDPSDEYEGFDS